eukprot:jgi/Ulvmu1/4231/UM191_0004.1
MMSVATSTLGLVSIAIAAPRVLAAGMDQLGGQVSIRDGQSIPADAGQDLSWNLCQSCEWGVRSVQDFVANPDHQDEVAAVLDSVACKFFPSTEKPKCESRIRAAIRHAVETFEDNVSPSSMCRPLCGNDELYLTARPAAESYQNCAYCQYTADQLPKIGGPPDQFDKALLDVCNSLPAPFQDACQAFVQEYGEEVAEAAQNSPGACVATGLCEIPGFGAIADEEMPEDLHNSLALGFAKIGAMHLKQTCSEHKDLESMQDQECDFCKIAVREARQKLADPVFQSEILKYLEKMCANTGDFNDICKQYIMQYGPIAFALAEQYLVPAKVCIFVHLCPLPPPPMGV